MATTKRIFTSDELVSAVRDAINAGNTLSTGTDNVRILNALNISMETQIIPELLKTREEYYVRAFRTAIAAATARYRISPRAFMLKLRKLYWVTPDGDLKRLDPKDPEDFDDATGDPQGYHIEGTDILLLPEPSAAHGYLQQSIYFRPGNLVLTTDARQVIAVNLSTRVVTVSGTLPTEWTTSNLFDIHSQVSGAEIKCLDLVATGLVGSTITFSSANPINGSVFGTKAVEVGDWLCLAGEAAVPGLPREMHGLLIDAAALRILKAHGDRQGIQSEATLLKADLTGMIEQVENRNEGSPMRITGKRGILRAGRR